MYKFLEEAEDLYWSKPAILTVYQTQTSAKFKKNSTNKKLLILYFGKMKSTLA